jgi:hypothetical protein
MSKRWLKVVLTVVLLAQARPSFAQTYGQFTPAQGVPMSGHLFGGYLQASENFLGLMAQLRLSFYPNIDFGFQGGLTRTDVGSHDITTLRVGGDLKCQVVRGKPMDVAIGAALGVETGDNIHLLTLGPTVTVSRSFGKADGVGITPYAGLGLLFTNADLFDHQSTDFAVPFRFGTEFRLAPELRLLGEVQLRSSDQYSDEFAFVTGVNLPF